MHLGRLPEISFALCGVFLVYVAVSYRNTGDSGAIHFLVCFAWYIFSFVLLDARRAGQDYRREQQRTHRERDGE